MDHLASMRAFVTVGRTQSFTKAADLLGVSKPQLSRAIADLEGHTHSLLFHRTTRRVSLADGARDYFETCTQILEQLEEAEQMLTEDKNSVAGQLKVVAHPLAVVAGLASMLAAYGTRTPDVQIQFTVQAGPLNLEDSGYDVALYPPQLILNTTVISVLCHGDAELGLQYLHKRLMPRRARSFVDGCLDFFTPGNRIPEGQPSLLAA